MNGPSMQSAHETRSRLLNAANQIFSELGYRAATIRMICERAQANAAAVNYYFGDKVGLYIAVVEANIGEETISINGRELLEMEPEAAFGEFVARLFHGLASSDGNRQHIRIMLNELSQPTPALAAVVKQIIRPQGQILCQIIARITGWPSDSPNAEQAAQSVISQVMHYMHAEPILKALRHDDPTQARSHDEIIAHIIQFSLCGLRAR